MLRALQAVIDVGNEQMHTMQPRRTIPLITLPSGHITVPITDFGLGPFRMHADAGNREDFEIPTHDRAAMSAQISSHQFVGEYLPFDDEPVAKNKGRSSQDGPARVDKPEYNPRKAIRNWRAMLDKIAEILVLADIQELVEDWCPSLARSEPSIELDSTASRTLQDLYAHIIAHGAPAMAAIEEQDTSYGGCGGLPSSQKGASGWREQSHLIHLLRPVQQPVEEYTQGYGAAADGEGVASRRSPELGGDQSASNGVGSPTIEGEGGPEGTGIERGNRPSEEMKAQQRRLEKLMEKFHAEQREATHQEPRQMQQMGMEMSRMLQEAHSREQKMREMMQALAAQRPHTEASSASRRTPSASPGRDKREDQSGARRRSKSPHREYEDAPSSWRHIGSETEIVEVSD